jgi:Tfp pilus assembly protein PilN
VAVAVLTVAALLLGLIPTYVVLAVTRDRTAEAQLRLDHAQVTLGQAQADQDQLEQVKQQIEQVREQIAQLDAELGTVSRQGTPRSGGITAIAAALVPSVRVTTISQAGDTLTVTGEVDDPTLVLDFARALQSSGQFANVRILSITNADTTTPHVEFLIQMEL